MSDRDYSRKNDFLNESKSRDRSAYGFARNRTNNHRDGSRKRGRIRVVWLIIIDVLIAALLLLVFSLYYFILPRDLSEDAVVLPTSTSTSSPAQTASAASQTDALQTDTQQTETSSQEAVAQTTWGDKFPDKFTDGTVEKTDHSYKSANINVTVSTVQKDDVTYYVADIYVTDLEYFRTAFAQDTFGSGIHTATDELAQQNNAVIAINGDYCGNNAGTVVRNGVLYREETYKDVLVMYNDGSMETFTADTFDINEIKSKGAYQVFTFGPMLLDNGQPMETFNSTVNPANPRTAVGYYEPGHYCFVVVDGRQPGYSSGYTLKEMSQLFYDMGCTVAFNLDGGQSSEMAFMGELVNQPYDGGRGTSDILYIADNEGA